MTKNKAPDRPAVSLGLDEKLVDALIDQLGVDEEEITWDTKLVDDLGADSLDVVELSMQLEGIFNIDVIDDAMVESWATVRDVHDTLKKLGAVK